MPFKKGKATPGAGRKGYEIEQAQLNRMREFLDKDMDLLEKFYEGKLSKGEFAILQAGQARILKYLDKLHATKSESEETKRIELPTPLLDYLDQQTEELKKLK